MECFEQSYLELIAVINEKLPEIKHVDLWWQQTDFEQSEDLCDYPALFLQFSANSFTTLPKQVQDVDANIDFFVAIQSMEESHRGSNDQTKALYYLRLLTKLHSVMQGRTGANYYNLNRIGLSRYNTNPAVIVYQVTYNCSMRDYSAKPVEERVTLNNEPEITKGTKPAESGEKLYYIDL
jgi:hypothetical protein